MKFGLRLVILITFIISFGVLYARNNKDIINSDTIPLNQKSVSYIYNRALDLAIRHSNILNRSASKFLFNPLKDTVFVQPEIIKTFAVSPRYDGPPELIHEVNIKNYYQSIIYFLIQ